MGNKETRDSRDVPQRNGKPADGVEYIDRASLTDLIDRINRDSYERRLIKSFSCADSDRPTQSQ